jgi:uncharacterized protein (TIGR02300 family)
VAKPELGTKRQCMSCGAKFYDLNKDPATCPKCGTVYQAASLTRVPPPVVARSSDEDETETATTGPELVSLDDVDAGEAEKDLPIDEDDIDVAEDVADDTFLEEEEEGEDDVSDLIDGDIEDDEEA